ncbi:hypothetical protein RKD45_004430 [Streptomyces griseus]
MTSPNGSSSHSSVIGGNVSQSRYARKGTDRSCRPTVSLPALSTSRSPRPAARIRSTKSANIRLTPCQTPMSDENDVAKNPTRKSFAVPAPKRSSRTVPRSIRPRSPFVRAICEACSSSAPTMSIATTKMPVVR